ncbi:hypothetical protein [Marinicella meishanensis]|uniref:hypothetical protein n=1 Tax=Marinicella meishanensis TaxID=2873263 RepID=UPI001CC0E18A|nr:hypothetical protein [Marinicella sp. NBU2979]
MKKLFVLLCLSLLSHSSQAILITGSFTGAWYDDENAGHGYLLQILEQDGNDIAMVFWFTYDAQGNQTWLNGLGEVEGESVTMELLEHTGGEMSAGVINTTGISAEAWGTLTLTFQNCNKGTATYAAYDATIGSGSHTIKRLSRTIGSHCSGGISDNRPPTDPAMDAQYEFTNTGADDDASGRVKLEINSQFTKLKVWYKDLPAGTYELLVNGDPVAMLQARGNGNNHQFFSSPVLAGWLLLDFAVEGKTLDIAQGGTVYLTVTLP